MKALVFFIILILAVLNLDAERINKDEIIPHPDQENHHNENYWSKEIRISKDLVLKPELNITYRGSGCLKIANLDIHICASGHNIINFKNGLLDVDFVDINGDGCKDMVISGLALYTDEKRETVLKREPLLYIYLFDSEKKEFKLAYINASFHLSESEPGAKDNRDLYGKYDIIENYIREGRAKAAIENSKKYDGIKRECIRIKSENFKKMPESDSKANLYTKITDIGHELKYEAKITDIYPREGSFEIANLKLYPYSPFFSMEGQTFCGLDIDMVDINNDGYLDLIISGMLNYQYHPDDSNAGSYEHLVYIYLFDPAKKEFRCVYRNASFKLEEPASKYVESRVSEVKNAIDKLNSSLEKKRIELAVPEFKQAVSQ